TGRTAGAGEARVSVGGRGGGVAAQIRLVRLGTGRDAPWEVVGAAATELTITTPAYGAAVSSPLAVGGHATGPGARVRVEVRQRSVARPIGTFCCTRAGGAGGRWTATVTFSGAADQVVTVVASTGGRAAVEHFAVTAVRAAR
ncbi:MAG TPA: Gmad2 immunoglobulin-like domain-containing protein, partial [Streptosporangiaceae bacterium]